MNPEQEAKIKKLREVYVGEDNKLAIDDIEKAMRENIARAQLTSVKVVQDILRDAADRVNGINALLSYDETLSDTERRALFKERSVWQFNLDRFGMSDATKIVENLAKIVDEKLKE